MATLQEVQDEIDKLIGPESDESGLGQASLASPLPGGSAGPSFGPGEDIHIQHIPMMPSKGVGSASPKLEVAKPTLHKGEIYNPLVSKHNFDIYKTPEGDNVYYHYHKNGEPWFATIPAMGNLQYKPEDVKFPPPSGASGAKSGPPLKPTLHTGSPTFATPDSAHYKTPDGGEINYHWAKGQPWFADYLAPGAKYGSEEGHTAYEGDNLHAINWPKVPGPEDYAKGKPKATADEASAAERKFNSLLETHSQTKWPANNWRAYEDLYAEHHAPFTTDEKAALKSGASSISGKLWKENLGGLEPEKRERMAHLDSAMDKSQIPTNLRVWSGVNDKVWQDIAHMDLGEIYLHKGFMSTSLSRDTAEQFIKGDFDTAGSGGLLRLHLPKGSRGIILGRLGPMREEHEVLLPRGVMLRKMTNEHGDDGIIDVEVAPGLGAFHGSAAEFEKFDLSKAGSGEGTAHIKEYSERPSVPNGAFLAQSEKVGEKYREKLAEEKLGDPSGGWLYKIHVKAHPQELFDWNKPFQEQSPQVRAAFDQIREKTHTGPLTNPPRSMTGKQIIDYYGPGTIEKLANYGVKGIRFLDKYSRKQGYGTQNYVIFDDNVLQVIGKKGASK